MPIRTRLRPAFWIRKLALGVFFLVFTMIAARAGWITYPTERDRYAIFMEYSVLSDYPLAELTAGERERLVDLQRQLGEMHGPPVTRTNLDVLLQQILAALGFVLAIVFFISWWMAARWSCELRDDGTLITPDGTTIPPGKMKRIDTAEWAERKLARLEIDVKSTGNDARSVNAVRLDGWSHDGVGEIIDAIAARLRPSPTTEADSSLMDQQNANTPSAESDETRKVAKHISENNNKPRT